MLEIKEHIVTKTGEYPVVFSFNVLEEIQNKYDTFDNWSHLIEGESWIEKDKKWKKGEPRISDIKYFIKIAINEGIDLENEINNKNRPFMTDKQVGRLISEVGVAKISKIIKNVIKESVGEENATTEEKIKN